MDKNEKDQNIADDSYLAALWNQHEFCPECRSRNVKIIEKVVKSPFHRRIMEQYKCLNCGCSWL